MNDNERIERVHANLSMLQGVLQKKFDLEAEIEALPMNLKTMKKELAEANAQFAELTIQHDKLKDEAYTVAHKYDEAVEERTKSEQKMGLISTLRESELLTKEIEEAKINEKNLLKQKKSVTLNLDEVELALKNQEEVKENLNSIVNEESEKIESSLAEIKAQISVFEKECSDITSQEVDGQKIITPEIFNKFSNIVKNKNGVGIVPIHSEVCTGCNMVLPSQFVNDVRSNDDIEYCPYCSRILFYEESNDVIEYDDFNEVDDSGDSSFDEYADSDDFDI